MKLIYASFARGRRLLGVVRGMRSERPVTHHIPAQGLIAETCSGGDWHDWRGDGGVMQGHGRAASVQCVCVSSKSPGQWMADLCLGTIELDVPRRGKSVE